MSPPRKQALATWQSFYHTMINRPGQIVNRLLPMIRQCEAVEADSLKTNKIHMVRQMSRLKIEFDTSGLRTQFELDLMELQLDGLVSFYV